MSAFDRKATVQYAVGAAITALLHPIGSVKILVQLGYEPVPPVAAKSVFAREALYYPNLFGCLRHLSKREGLLTLYRGVVPKIIGGALGNFTYSCVYQLLDPPSESSDEPEPEHTETTDDVVAQIKEFTIKTSKESVAKFAAIIVTQPFHVIMVRSIAQMVGGETQYNSLFSSVREIYKNDGILGFFSGLVPRVLGDLITFWLASVLTHFVNNYLVEDKQGEDTERASFTGIGLTAIKSYTNAACSLVVTHLTYPFTLVETIMSANSSGLQATSPPRMPKFTGWLDCWRYLSAAGELKRGSSIFWRIYNGPVIQRDGHLAAHPNHENAVYMHQRLRFD